MTNIGAPKIKGRGMVKWQPFASMPEQFIGIKQLIEDQTKIQRPIVTQDMKEEIERALLESMKLQKTIMISYYQDGQILHETVVVKAIAQQMGMVFFRDLFGFTLRLGFGDVVAVD
ncbi:YolD-like family protein [Bacillus sp. UNC322MFChir4.1]|uniref:YolD-like family protein n=1 Tax=Bacillus sp. UNC322MFChir4.1 TaxID=1449045 RepID=UPI00054EC79A|nr:YolD-like family protein [Bacillus sp. UNC322MFChir4.1]